MSEGYWWLMYTLAGAAVAWAILRVMREHPDALEQLERDALRAHPPIQAFALLFVWATWPLWAIWLVGLGVLWLWGAAWDAWDERQESGRTRDQHRTP